jgi:hypothetical protein
MSPSSFGPFLHQSMFRKSHNLDVCHHYERSMSVCSHPTMKDELNDEPLDLYAFYHLTNVCLQPPLGLVVQMIGDKATRADSREKMICTHQCIRYDESV